MCKVKFTRILFDKLLFLLNSSNLKKLKNILKKTSQKNAVLPDCLYSYNVYSLSGAG